MRGGNVYCGTITLSTGWMNTHNPRASRGVWRSGHAMRAEDGSKCMAKELAPVRRRSRRGLAGVVFGRNASAELGLLRSPAGRCDASLNPLATGDKSCPQVWAQGLNWLGATPLQRTKAWRKLAVSLKPSSSAMRWMGSWSSQSICLARSKRSSSSSSW